eukprot:GHVH01008982.1.p1 GENE.GHVH01008982.1~~GHVH01008982.1.p1  ORF type:complete len:183 (+),score=16.15 GHVH01008982.1:445-993(+)
MQNMIVAHKSSGNSERRSWNDLPGTMLSLLDAEANDGEEIHLLMEQSIRRGSADATVVEDGKPCTDMVFELKYSNTITEKLNRKEAMVQGLHYAFDNDRLAKGWTVICTFIINEVPGDDVFIGWSINAIYSIQKGAKGWREEGKIYQNNKKSIHDYFSALIEARKFVIDKRTKTGKKRVRSQ